MSRNHGFSWKILGNPWKSMIWTHFSYPGCSPPQPPCWGRADGSRGLGEPRQWRLMSLRMPCQPQYRLGSTERPGSLESTYSSQFWWIHGFVKNCTGFVYNHFLKRHVQKLSLFDHIYFSKIYYIFSIWLAQIAMNTTCFLTALRFLT